MFKNAAMLVNRLVDLAGLFLHLYYSKRYGQGKVYFFPPLENLMHS